MMPEVENCIVCMAPVEVPCLGIEPKCYAFAEHCQTNVDDQKIQISLRGIKMVGVVDVIV